MIEFILPSTSAILNKLGFVGDSNEYPVIFAPAFNKIRQSQVPLNPVCPVINTFFPLYQLKSYTAITGTGKITPLNNNHATKNVNTKLKS